MKRSEIIQTVTGEAVSSFEGSCSWPRSVEVIREELIFHGLKPTRPLVLFVLKLAKLAWLNEVDKVKRLIEEEK